METRGSPLSTWKIGPAYAQPMRSRSNLPVPAALAAAALLPVALAGCSSSTPGHGTGGTSAISTMTPASVGGSASAPTTPAAGTGPASSSSSSPLAAINLTAKDLPAGWTAAPATPTSGADAARAQAQIAACVGGRNTYPDSTGVTQSPDFSQGEATISSQVTAYRSQQDVDSDVAMLSSPKIDSCYAAEAKAQAAGSLPAGATISAVSVHVTPHPSGEPANVAAMVVGTISVTASGQQVTVYDTSALITGPKVEVDVDFENIGQPLPGALQDHLIAVVAGRARTA